MDSFQPGDQVQLRSGSSGGSPMLVTNDNANGTVVCFWFSDAQDQLVWRSFAKGDLKRVETQPQQAIHVGSRR
ncbi:MAG: hypothetical protein EOO31_07715 [Comamonadaceae bacterium]|nr:MAG: hypothetical protein EOO31_07715 [Comamonadaceae bacterium]